MASHFAEQLKGMFFVFVERLTGYGGRADEQQEAAGAQEAAKLASGAEGVRPVVKNIQIRARGGDPMVPPGSKPQINVEGL